MITRDNINEIYRKYRKTPAAIDDLDFAALFDDTAIYHDILIDPEEGVITFGSIEPESPFHRLQLRNINAILAFEDWVAIVMHSSILFLDRHSSRAVVDIKAVRQGVGRRISSLFCA